MTIEKLIEKQQQDGSFGMFHSMSQDNSITTEKALRRFLFLDLDKKIPIVQKTIEYLKKCLYHEITIPDRREKVINWDAFEELMFSAWLNLFKVEDCTVYKVQLVWKKVIEDSVIDNQFSMEEYKKQYRCTFGVKGQREIDPSSFYMASLLVNQLSPKAKQAYFHYLMEQGIFYIYGNPLTEVPVLFDSKNTIYYLIAIKIVSSYASNKEDLKFILDWLEQNKSLDGDWHMTNLKPDGIVFPISNNWKHHQDKLKDINQFIDSVFVKLKIK